MAVVIIEWEMAAFGVNLGHPLKPIGTLSHILCRLRPMSGGVVAFPKLPWDFFVCVVTEKGR